MPASRFGTASSPCLLIHGGAGSIPEDGRARQMAASLRRIAAQGYAVLAGGGSALDAAVNAVRLLEDDPLFNAGTGSKLQIDGRARMSAAVMDGASERFAGVVNIEELANPILLSRALLDDDARVLAGPGALARARELGLPEKDVRTAERIAAWEARMKGGDPDPSQQGRTGTVGAVALDLRGDLAAATSTGGRGYEAVGRVSDTPTVAATYANSHAAVSLTGVGEHIVDGALGARLVAMVEGGLSLEQAQERLLAHMHRRRWEAGLIAVDARGDWIAGNSTPGMSWWLCGGGGEAGFRAVEPEDDGEGSAQASG